MTLLAPPPSPLDSGDVIGFPALDSGYVKQSPARTFALGLVRAEGPPGVALLAHVSSIRGATAAGLGRAVRTDAHVH